MVIEFMAIINLFHTYFKYQMEWNIFWNIYYVAGHAICLAVIGMTKSFYNYSYEKCRKKWKHLISEVNESIEPTGIILTWIEDYNEKSRARIWTEFRCCGFESFSVPSISGFDVTMDVCKREQFCQTKGIPFNLPKRLEIPEKLVPWVTHKSSYKVYMDVSAQNSNEINLIPNPGFNIKNESVMMNF